MGLTDSQRDAVAARGNVIVVAGAGTGKTSTLVERCIALLDEGCSIESILMVTFTDAAAAEMRHRLRDSLLNLALESEGEARRKLWWQEQVALLDTARICTLHSFCLQVVRENFHLLGIDPAVKILDEQQMRPLVQNALDATLQPHFEGSDDQSAAVRDLIHRYGLGARERIAGMILQIHQYAQSLESPNQWFNDQVKMLGKPDSWRVWLSDAIRDWAISWQPILDQFPSEAENVARCAELLRKLSKTRDGHPAFEFLNAIVDADKNWVRGQKTKLRGPIESFFDEAAFFASQFTAVGASDGLHADWESVQRPLVALLNLTKQFGAALAEAKRELGGIDFADLEQFALKVLWDEKSEVTAVAQEYRATFEHVFVDECQDINAAQDAMLRAVSRSSTPANRFLVGDVKQSIYRFRMARPELFRGYEDAWSEGTGGRRIFLSENFRSAPAVIDFVNALFGPLMREEVSAVGYVPLVAGRSAGEFGEMPEDERAVEFHLIPKGLAEQATADGEAADSNKGGAGTVEDLLITEREARLVALRLRELYDAGIQIWDKEFKQLRRVEWRDMAVLLRSPRGRVEAFAQEFHKCGVPIQAARGGFLASTEILDLLSLLRLIDNPLQDIPLLAVSRSPLVALTLDELAEVRVASRERRLWVALRAFHSTCADKTTAVWTKVDSFLKAYSVWRELSRQTALSQCLERVLNDTQYEAIVGAGDRGTERVANVRKLVRTVREYDPFQRQGLHRFLKFVDGLLEAEQDLEPAPAPSQNAVRLMSVHQSKGLEFPVVVVACLGTRFNLGDIYGDILLDESYGVCAKAVVEETNSRHPTLPHWLAAKRQKQQSLGEEMRLLYVALTRARDRLILTGTAARKDAESWEEQLGREFTAAEVFQARAPLDWLLLWLPAITRTTDWSQMGGLNQLLSWRIWSDAQDLKLPLPADDILSVTLKNEISPAGLKEIYPRLQWSYPHGRATTESAKATVTTLRRRAAELLDEDAADWSSGATAKRVAIHGDSALGAAELGSVYHRFLELMQLSGSCDESDLRAQLATFTQQGVFAEAEAHGIDINAVARFWQSEVGQLIRSQSVSVRREVPFTARFTLAELADITGEDKAGRADEEFVVVQGVADLVVMTENELWVLDFKTDDVSGKDLKTRVERYRPQLRIYALALAGVYGKQSYRCWLHFLRPGETVEL